MGDTGSSTADRMLAVLDVFSLERPAWSIEDIARRLGYTDSSTYRYVRSLLKCGLLTRVPGGQYVLGAKIIELDSLIRLSDPVTLAAREVLERLSQETNCHTLLSSIHGAHVVNVLHVPGKDPLALTFVRGHRLPWFRGAPGKAVLSRMARAQARQLYAAETPGQPVDEARWNAQWTELKQIRKAGYCVSREELDEHVIGFGAAIAPNQEVIGSISLVCSAERLQMLNAAGLGRMLMSAASEIEGRLTQAAPA